MLLGTTESIPAKLTKVKYFSTRGVAGPVLKGPWTPPREVGHSSPASKAGEVSLGAFLNEFGDQRPGTPLARGTACQQSRWHAIDFFSFPFAKGMADRVDAPGDMMGQEDPHEATPEQARPATQRKGNHQPQHRPEQEGAAHEDDQPIFHQMGQ